VVVLFGFTWERGEREEGGRRRGKVEIEREKNETR
jgi:hypothetical protein